MLSAGCSTPSSLPPGARPEAPGSSGGRVEDHLVGRELVVLRGELNGTSELCRAVKKMSNREETDQNQ